MSEVSPRGTLSATGVEVKHQGLVRDENQDNVRKASLPIGELFIVADGIGGYQGGAIASQMVVDGFHSQLAIKPANYPPDAALQEACNYTNSSIHARATSGDPATQRMGSTVVLALIQAGGQAPMAWVGHVGDSRAYLVRGGRMSKITNDHSAVQALLSRNLITEEEARNHPDASVLTRSLGHRPEVEIEIDAVPLQAGDALMLCSDGLWGYVAESDIEAVVTNPSLSMDTVSELLLRLALDAGGQDNIGIQYIRISGTAPGASAPLPVAFPAAASGAAAAAHAETAKHHRARNLQMAAVALLLLGGLGSLALAWKLHRFPFNTATSPKTKTMKVALAGDPNTSMNVRHTGANGSTVWVFASVAPSAEPSCAALAERKVRIFGDGSWTDKAAFVAEIAAQGGLETIEQQVAKTSDGFESLSDDIKARCGKDVNIVVVLPKDSPAAAAGKKTVVQPGTNPPGVRPPNKPAPRVPGTPGANPNPTTDGTNHNHASDHPNEPPHPQPNTPDSNSNPHE